MSKTILITGATGNVGEALIKALFEHDLSHRIIAGVRNIEKGRRILSKFDKLEYRLFDFETPSSHDSAFENIDTLFLLRPPHISDVERVFRPLVDLAVRRGIKQIVFLSVQGADKMSFIPHAKIEKLIKASGISYCFIRPSYFMQNLTTTLKSDLETGTIVLPAGEALFNWVDVDDIGRATAAVVDRFESFVNQGVDITGDENLSFSQVVEIINSACGKSLRYRNANLISFFSHKSRQGVPLSMIVVMIALHFLPRWQRPPRVSDNYRSITGKQPTTLKEFALRQIKCY